MAEFVRVPSAQPSQRNYTDLLASGITGHLTGYALSRALFTLTKSGAADVLVSESSIDPRAFAREKKLDTQQMIGLLRFLAIHGICEEREGRFWIQPQGRASLSAASRMELEFYVGGYGELMDHADALLDGSMQYGRDISRNGAYVAAGSAAPFRLIYSDVAFAALERAKGRRVLDLGCGDAAFLIDLCRRYPDATGVGIDVDAISVDRARAAVHGAGLGDRIRILQGNAFRREVYGGCADGIDVIHSFAMQHELFRDGEQAVIDCINAIAETFQGKKYLLGEPLLELNRTDSIFYWIHVLSCQGIPRNVEGWCSLLPRCKPQLEAVYTADHGTFGAYFVLRL
jgi:hypothetical protein